MEEIKKEFFRKMPKIDLHRHLEGSLTPQIIMDVAVRHGLELPAKTTEKLVSYVQITEKVESLIAFLKKFDTLGKLFTNKDVISDFTEQVIRDADRDNVRYLELRFSPTYMASCHKLSQEEVMEGVIRGMAKARETSPRIKVNLIVIVDRTLGCETGQKTLDLAIKHKNDGVRAVDLASDEYNYPPDPYAETFHLAKKSGLWVTVHAGEAGGPESVASAVRKCQADRIGHGVRVVLDKCVEQEIKEKRIPLEVCVTSNVQTGAVSDLASHPIRYLYEQDIIVTVNTDDPAVSGITLSDEYYLLSKEFRFSTEDLEKLLFNALEVSFLTADEKEELKAVLEKDLQILKEEIHF